MKLKIGIVGYNLVGKRHYMELRRSDKFEVCGVFDKENRDDACRAPFFDDFNREGTASGDGTLFATA